MPLSAPTTLAHLTTDEPTARAIADGLGEMFEPEEIATAAFEIASLEAGLRGASTAPAKTAPAKTAPAKQGREGAMGTLHPDETGPWRLELHFAFEPDEDEIRALVAGFSSEETAEKLVFEPVAATDWVASALEGLKPVTAGRFLVHGAHDREAVRIGQIGIEIEAALAFGTGHHGTTRGCLEHITALLKRRRPRRIVDIGTGTGVLAIGLAKALNQPVLGGEIDPDSVAIARGNARLNGVGDRLKVYRAAGLQHPALRRSNHYDLVLANILARPLKGISRQVGLAAGPGCALILSGLLPGDVPGVLSAYRRQGFALAAKRQIEDWVSLTLQRGGQGSRPLLHSGQEKAPGGRNPGLSLAGARGRRARDPADFLQAVIRG
ncbi:MAG: 50S ribosomal protein L11 methyltransferase [Methylobacterium sp.]|nr:50S ribosomal protein L11 methyltransferase [Methylobacterium sp.]MCA3606850.1 50S ribosomal protein L11 methyltransferase [Methylobacterium sp.]MCA3608473.1 50S ribosomal protein L11 methyltransferase [Methylobacterium sp.]MCA3617526.1 50S ribosomal protein L11 methyltransferase [Methylobacterium sp.]MCA3620538.1 50S ribosomal protein L11 methyltransferase [Methylobacterium sp.]